MALIAEMTGSGEWKEAFNRAKEFVGKMTLDEKVFYRHVWIYCDE